MALSLNTIRNGIQTSIYGRRLGLTITNELLVGFNGVREVIEDLTTVPTTLAAFGVSVVGVTGSSQGPVQHFLPVPIAGVEKTIILNTTSTASHQFLSTANGASIRSASDGSTKSLVNMLGGGGALTLLGLSSAAWVVKGLGVGAASSGATPNISYTTST